MPTVGFSCAQRLVCIPSSLISKDPGEEQLEWPLHKFCDWIFVPLASAFYLAYFSSIYQGRILICSFKMKYPKQDDTEPVEIPGSSVTA